VKIKFLLSDLDGVIRLYPPERAASIERKFSLPSGVILATAFEKNLLSRVVCGLISDEDWRSEVAKCLSIAFGEKIAMAAIQEWSDFSGIVDNRYLFHVESKFLDIPVALLTNGTSRLNADLKKLGIEKRFFRIFNSADIGICKPDKKIFQHVANDLCCEPIDILFVDDSLSHIQAAKELGMLTHHYTSFESFVQMGNHE
jgi:FMN phosphatase YigB (HAD superfamily)